MGAAGSSGRARALGGGAEAQRRGHAHELCNLSHASISNAEVDPVISYGSLLMHVTAYTAKGGGLSLKTQQMLSAAMGRLGDPR
jgi:hypothetical protein